MTKYVLKKGKKCNASTLLLYPNSRHMTLRHCQKMMNRRSLFWIFSPNHNVILTVTTMSMTNQFTELAVYYPLNFRYQVSSPIINKWRGCLPSQRKQILKFELVEMLETLLSHSESLCKSGYCPLNKAVLG